MMVAVGSGIEKLFEGYADPLDPDEVAAILRLSPQTVRRELRAGQLPGFRTGNGKKSSWRVPKADLIDHLKAQSNQPLTVADDIELAGDGGKAVLS
jgi:excisionase family DNA binding protein